MSKPRKTAVGQTKVAGRRERVAYGDLIGGIAGVLEVARRASARAINAVMTATYWEIGRRIVEHEQRGVKRAEYGEFLLKELGKDLTARFGRGFGWRNLFQMRGFYLAYPPEKLQTPSAISAGTASRASAKTATLSHIPGEAPIFQKSSEESVLARIAARFPLPWSAYTRLLAVKNENARSLYLEGVASHRRFIPETARRLRAGSQRREAGNGRNPNR